MEAQQLLPVHPVPENKQLKTNIGDNIAFFSSHFADLT
jgi:hypothetical protein